MRGSRPSFTAREVARSRATLERPTVATGDAAAEHRLYETLGRARLRRPGGGSVSWRARMQRRTAFFDREVLTAIDGGADQVVIVAAGYDGRALRFATPGVRFFEVDHPATQADKRARLERVGPSEAAGGAITFVAVDLTTDDLPAALAGAGHDARRASLFLVEGLLGYLSLEVTAGILGGLRAVASESSRMALTFLIRPTGGRRRLGRWVVGRMVAARGEPWLTFFDPGEPERLLEAAGWAVAVDGGRPVRLVGPTGMLVSVVPASTRPGVSAPGPATGPTTR